VSEVPDPRGPVSSGGKVAGDAIAPRREVAAAKDSFTDETAALANELAGSRDSFLGDTEDSVKPTAATAGDGNTTTDGTKVEEFGPYVVYERLGQGGMATVHRAEKRGIGFRRPVALKRLFPHVAADPELVKLFVDEARLASHLHHGNIAQTYELGRVGDIYFIAMEYASGPTLGQIVRQCQQAGIDIPLTITVSILTQVCDALEYAHNLCDESGRSLRIIHRDVSPANIIVSGTGIVKLIDFGIAKATTSSVKTQTGFIKGKFGYIAPEYITGKIDARVDLFALGVIAHEMLAGRRLFEGKDDFETMANIREMVVQPPSRWNPQVPADLDDIVMTALERDPAKRWRTAGAMQIALASAARELGVVVGSQQVVEWVEWAFNQAASDSGPNARPEPHTDETNALVISVRPDRRPGSSLSIELEVSATDGLEASTMPGSKRAASIAADAQIDDDDDDDSDATVAIERTASPHDSFETVTPPPRTPVPVPKPGTPVPTPTVPTRAVSPSDSMVGKFTPTPMRTGRTPRPALPFGTSSPRTPAPPPDATQPTARTPITLETAVPPPPAPLAPASSVPAPSAVPTPTVPITLEPMPPPLPSSGPRVLPRATREMPDGSVVLRQPHDVELIVVPPGAMFQDAPDGAEPPKPVRKLKPRSQLKATQRTRPEPRPAATLVPAKGSGPRAEPGSDGRRLARRGRDDPDDRRQREALANDARPGKIRGALWLLLVILALGTGAMATVYYWPDL
jgi:eukaryotic-like serine/threonine-protein kinase